MGYILSFLLFYRGSLLVICVHTSIIKDSGYSTTIRRRKARKDLRVFKLFKYYYVKSLWSIIMSVICL